MSKKQKDFKEMEVEKPASEKKTEGGYRTVGLNQIREYQDLEEKRTQTREDYHSSGQ